MIRKLGQIRRSQSEDIYLLLREIHGAPHVELRVYHRSVGIGGDPVPGHEGIAVPVDVLPALLRVLGQTLERLVQDGVVQDPSPSRVIAMETGEPITLGASNPGGRRRDSRREPRVPLKLPVGCRLVSKVSGETKDVSSGGAQVWLPERFPLFSRVEIHMRIGGRTFEGRAEVVGVEAHPSHEGYRHSLRWMDLTAKAKSVLSQAIPAC